MPYEDMEDIELVKLKAAVDEEMKRRQEVKRERDRVERNRKNKIILDNIDLFLELNPHHTATTCSDDNPINYRYSRCTRCILLTAKIEGYLPDNYALLTQFLSAGDDQ